MSDTRERAGLHRQSVSTGQGSGLPLWSPLMVIAAACLTGMLLGLDKGQLGITYFALFAVAYVVCSAFVQIRGLLLTWTLGPIIFAIGTPFAAMVCANATAAEATEFFNRAAVATSTFAMVQGYMWLLVATGLSALIGLVRWFAARRRLNQTLASHRQQRMGAERATARQHATMNFRQRATNLADEAWEEDSRPETDRRHRSEYSDQSEYSAHSQRSSRPGRSHRAESGSRRSTTESRSRRSDSRRRASEYGQTSAAQRGESRTASAAKPKFTSKGHAASNQDLFADPARTASAHELHEDFRRRLRQERSTRTGMTSSPRAKNQSGSHSSPTSSETVPTSPRSGGRHSVDDRPEGAWTLKERAPERIEKLPPRSQRPRYRR